MLFLSVATNSIGQNSPVDSIRTDSGKSDINKPVAAKNDVIRKTKLSENAKSFHTPNETELTIYFLIFGSFVLIIAAYLLHHSSVDSNNTFKYFIIILLILGMLILVAIGLDKDQITPAVGLFGTIAGYLLGKTDTPPPSVNKITPSSEKITSS